MKNISSNTIIYFLILKSICAFNIKDSNDLLFDGGFDLVDLTHNFNKKTVYWPMSTNFTSFNEVMEQNAKDGSWYASKDFCAGEHGGTHLDAPYHFDKNGAFVGDIALKNLILPLIIVDVSSQVNDDPNFVLYKRHLDNMLNNYFNRIEQPCVIVFKFGWSKFFYDIEKYLGTKKDGILSFPGLSGEVVEWIVSSYKNVVGVGVDVASADPGSSTDFPAHKALLGSGLYIMENVKLDQYVPESWCTALVLPMKIERGTGAPLRFVAICPKHRLNTTPQPPMHRI